MPRGVELLNNAVKVTLGPKGRNVMINKSYGGHASPRMASLSPRKSSLPDKFENMGARSCAKWLPRPRNWRRRTTTATVLAASILREGAKLVAAGMNPMDLKRGIDLGVARSSRKSRRNRRSAIFR